MITPSFRFQDMNTTLRGMVERQLVVSAGANGRVVSATADLALPPVLGEFRPSDLRSVFVKEPAGALADAIAHLGDVSRHTNLDVFRVVQPLEGAARVRVMSAATGEATTLLLEHAPAAIVDTVAAARNVLRLML